MRVSFIWSIFCFEINILKNLFSSRSNGKKTPTYLCITPKLIKYRSSLAVHNKILTNINDVLTVVMLIFSLNKSVLVNLPCKKVKQRDMNDFWTAQSKNGVQLHSPLLKCYVHTCAHLQISSIPFTLNGISAFNSEALKFHYFGLRNICSSQQILLHFPKLSHLTIEFKFISLRNSLFWQVLDEYLNAPTILMRTHYICSSK